MKTPWKEFFLLFKEERKQLLLFSILLVVFIVGRWTMPYWYPADKQFLGEVKLELVKAEKKLDNKKSFQLSSAKSIDINTNDTSKWEGLGFSKRQSEIIINFKNLIGGFETKEELKKVFIIDDTKYTSLEPLIFVSKNYKRQKRAFPKNEKSFPKREKKRVLNPVEFDPNLISENEMTKMGFSKYQVENWINYRNSGGKFYKKEDFARLYAIKEEDYEKVKSFLVFDSSIVYTKKKNVVNEVNSLNLNTCDSVQLVEVRGIGPYYARLIIDYRNKLGGYHSVNQLTEIGKIKEENLNRFIEKLFVAPNYTLIKMDLNSNDFKGFMKHPYFDYYHTKKLFDYKNKKGKFTSLRDLKKVGFIEPEYVDKITPYLKIVK